MDLNIFLASKGILAYPTFTSSEDPYSAWRRALLLVDTLNNLDIKCFRGFDENGEIERFFLPENMNIESEDIQWLNDEFKYYGIPVKVSIYAGSLLAFDKL